MDAIKPNTLDDETLLNLGLTVLHEILTRRLHLNTDGIVPKKKAVRQPKKVTQAAVLVSDEEVPIDLLNIEELTAEAYDSPPPTAAGAAPGAPKKKKAPAKKAETKVEEVD